MQKIMSFAEVSTPTGPGPVNGEDRSAPVFDIKTGKPITPEEHNSGINTVRQGGEAAVLGDAQISLKLARLIIALYQQYDINPTAELRGIDAHSTDLHRLLVRKDKAVSLWGDYTHFKQRLFTTLSGDDGGTATDSDAKETVIQHSMERSLLTMLGHVGYLNKEGYEATQSNYLNLEIAKDRNIALISAITQLDEIEYPTDDEISEKSRYQLELRSRLLRHEVGYSEIEAAMQATGIKMLMDPNSSKPKQLSTPNVRVKVTKVL